MEEIDKIILHTLRQIGCDLEEDVDSLGKFSTELVVEATARCLRLVNPSVEDLGYKGDIGYQTFLYSTETDIRRVFMFLIEKLPKESEKVIDEPLGAARLIKQKVCERLRQQLTVPWLPPRCRLRGLQGLPDGGWIREGFSSTKCFSSVPLSMPHSSDNYCSPPILDQLKDRSQLLPSLIVYNSEHLANGQHANVVSPVVSQKFEISLSQELKAVIAKPPVAEKPIPLPRHVSLKNEESAPLPAQRSLVPSDKIEPDTKLQEIRNTEEEKVQLLQQEVADLTSRFEELQANVRSFAVRSTKVGEEAEGIESELRNKEEKFAVQKRTSELLPEAETNVTKLQSLVEASTQRLTALASQWEKHRAPLVANYRELREKNSKRESESQRQAESLRLVRERIKDHSEEMRTKEQQHRQLTAECEKLTKDINRSAYTRRILEIISNIRKQKDEIDRVLADTRQVQKEINQLTGRLDRSFAVADELIFKDAKREEAARRSYKLLATLHADCADLVSLVQETGASMREIRDLEEQIETESAKNVAANLERITADLKQMKQESASLMAQLKSKS